MINDIKTILSEKYPEELVDALLNAYIELKRNYSLRLFKPSELEGGFFVEVVRRLIDIELFSNHIPIGKNLNNFNDVEMRRYEQGTGDESFRLHIPRILKSIYNLRNKRGVGHLSLVSPNLMDSTLIVFSCNWVLAELIRQNSNLPADRCHSIIDGIMEKDLPLIFDNGEVQRVLDPKIPLKEEILILLYHNDNKLNVDDLLRFTEYKNSSRFKTVVLPTLHRERLIEFGDKKCELTALGIKCVEEYMNKMENRLLKA
ncbi:hypothetical protein [Bacillus sp. FJAT-27245]|uniref:hypothetical protein n=1 Tax=Bacillus sp. FJAT-27245 TaxID=1684144 RepID=UPI0006A7EB4B|nr:hypothetical protein [Bacillus sp. FJAT-27245]